MEVQAPQAAALPNLPAAVPGGVSGVESLSALPRTGSTTPIGSLVAAGAGAIALGVGAVAVARRGAEPADTASAENPAEA